MSEDILNASLPEYMVVRIADHDALEAQVAELRAALIAADDQTPHSRAVLAATDDPSARVALRWLRSPEGQERLAAALLGMRVPHYSLTHAPANKETADDYKRMAAAIVAALKEEG